MKPVIRDEDQSGHLLRPLAHCTYFQYERFLVSRLMHFRPPLVLVIDLFVPPTSNHNTTLDHMKTLRCSTFISIRQSLRFRSPLFVVLLCSLPNQTNNHCDIFISSTGNFNHFGPHEELKNGTFLGNTGHLGGCGARMLFTECDPSAGVL